MAPIHMSWCLYHGTSAHLGVFLQENQGPVIFCGPPITPTAHMVFFFGGDAEGKPVHLHGPNAMLRRAQVSKERIKPRVNRSFGEALQRSHNMCNSSPQPNLCGVPSLQLRWKCKKVLSKSKVVFPEGSVHFHVSWWEGKLFEFATPKGPSLRFRPQGARGRTPCRGGRELVACVGRGSRWVGLQSIVVLFGWFA